MTAPAGRRAGRRELAVAAGLLLLVAAVVYAPNVTDGGFALDDWSHASNAEFLRDKLLRVYWELTANRPVLVVYVPLTHLLFGLEPALHHGWSILLAVAVSTTLYALLRRVGAARGHAWSIAALVLLVPVSDAARFWATASHINLSVALGIGGVLLALRGLDEAAAGRADRARRLRVAAVALYALSVLTYEIAGIALLLAGALYLTRAPWRTVRPLWAIDACVIVPCLAWAGLMSDRERLPLSEMLDHASHIGDGAIAVLAYAADPWGGAGQALTIAAIAVLVGVAAFVERRLPVGEVRASLRFWLIAAGAGGVLAVAGWLLYIPADPYYWPGSPGVGNRTNVMAAIGVIVAVYATVVLTATLLLHRMDDWRRWANTLTAAVALAVAVGYVHDVRQDQGAWIRAAQGSNYLLATVRDAIPRATPGDTIYTFGYPGHETWGIPVFYAQWDLAGAARVMYGERALWAYPVVEGTAVVCGPDRTGPSGAGWSPALHGAPYGRAVFVDVATGSTRRIDSRDDCQAALSRFVPGPSVRDP